MDDVKVAFSEFAPHREEFDVFLSLFIEIHRRFIAHI